MIGRWPNRFSKQSAYSLACCWPTQAFEFGVNRRLSGKQLRELGVSFGKLGLKLLNLRQRLRRDGRGRGQQHWVEQQTIRRFASFRICPCQPKANVKELADCRH